MLVSGEGCDMRHCSQFTESEIRHILELAARGMTPVDICRRYGISDQLIRYWQAEYGVPTPATNGADRNSANGVARNGANGHSVARNGTNGSRVNGSGANGSLLRGNSSVGNGAGGFGSREYGLSEPSGIERDRADTRPMSAESENIRLKRIVAELTIENQSLRERVGSCEDQLDRLRRETHFLRSRWNEK